MRIAGPYAIRAEPGNRAWSQALFSRRTTLRVTYACLWYSAGRDARLRSPTPPGGERRTIGPRGGLGLCRAPHPGVSDAGATRAPAGHEPGADRSGGGRCAGALAYTQAMSELPIRRPEAAPAAFHPWDPRTQDVAREVARLVSSARPGTIVEHVGSSAVPGLPGKNYVDLAIEVVPDAIPELTGTLLSLGFQPPGWPRAVPADTADAHARHRRARRHAVPHPPPRDAAGSRGARGAASRSGTPSDPTRRSATPTPPQSGGSSRPRPTARRTCCTRCTRATSSRTRSTGSASAAGPADPPEPLAPGATIGMLGGGQLGRMLGSAARAMGYRVIALDPDPDCPAAAVADEIVVGALRRRRGGRAGWRRSQTS